MSWKHLVLAILAVLLLALVAAMAWQHGRYLDARRDRVQDCQDVLHGDVFHVLTYLTASSDQSLLPSLSALKEAAEGEGRSQLIYAGKVIYNALASSQFHDTFGREVEWNAITLQQFESQDAYEQYLEDPGVQAALGAFPVRHAHGMKRSRGFSLLLPQLLLARKIRRAATFAPPMPELVPAAENTDIAFADLSEPMLAEADGLGRDAIVIVNLIKYGTAEQQAADANYGNQMLERMAVEGHGPMHIGASVPLDQAHDFDNVLLVYYPGSGYFRDLVYSTWYQSIVGDKQLGDSQASITVPVTDRL